jgi:hypothetical protein
MTKKKDGWWFTAKAAGAISLTAKAKAPDNTEVMGSITVTAVGTPVAAPNSWKLPFIGQGYGAVLIAVGVAAIVGALMAIDRIGGQGGIALLTAIVGYFFVASASSGSSGGGGGGAGSSGTGGSGGTPPASVS